MIEIIVLVHLLLFVFIENWLIAPVKRIIIFFYIGVGFLYPVYWVQCVLLIMIIRLYVVFISIWLLIISNIPEIGNNFWFDLLLLLICSCFHHRPEHSKP